MSSKKPRIRMKKGDMVLVTTGEDRGRKGKVLFVDPSHNRALVEGLNLIRKHMRKTQDNPQGGIVDREAPIEISNLKKIKKAD